MPQSLTCRIHRPNTQTRETHDGLPQMWAPHQSLLTQQHSLATQWPLHNVHWTPNTPSSTVGLPTATHCDSATAARWYEWLCSVEQQNGTKTHKMSEPLSVCVASGRCSWHPRFSKPAHTHKCNVASNTCWQLQPRRVRIHCIAMPRGHPKGPGTALVAEAHQANRQRRDHNNHLQSATYGSPST